MTLVVLDKVFARYGAGSDILKNVTLTLEAGSFHFLMGASGAGKSTLLRLLYLGMGPHAGQVRLFGRDVTHIDRNELPALRRRIGVVFQDFRLLKHLSAFENVALPLRLSGMKEAQIQDNVVELLRWVGLGGKLHDLPPSLSGGEQQRVAIARAVVTRPRLLLADEPTGNVDDAMAERLLYLLEELHKIGTTLLVATHNPLLPKRFSHPCLYLADGTVRSTAQTDVPAVSPMP